MARLQAATVAVFGIGGVGTYTVEALARSGVGGLVLVDDDSVCLTNINRQLIATHKTVGRKKVEVARERVLDINPRCRVEAVERFYSADTAGEIPAVILRLRGGRHRYRLLQARFDRRSRRRRRPHHQLHGSRQQARPDAAGGRRHL